MSFQERPILPVEMDLLIQARSGTRTDVSFTFQVISEQESNLFFFFFGSAAQPIPAKNLTDEELQQNFGIHLTSRITGGNDSKEPNWADIDDEDDWSPEAIEWNDGTKVTLSHAAPKNEEKPMEATPDRAPEKAPEGAPEKAPEREPEQAPEPTPAPAPTSVPTQPVQPSPPIAHASPPKPSFLGPKVLGPKSSGHPTILKSNGQSDAATSLANDYLPPASKSPTSAPTKSPWAPLPPVQKVPPVPFNPPHPSPVLQHQPPPRDFRSNARPESSHGPTKEFAADDFDRSWRASPSDGPRELFNSRSGQYEPVIDTHHGSRRSFARNEHPRPSQVLQRQAHNEPSAVSPTLESPSSTTTPWRRRASSTLSHSSAGHPRRLSVVNDQQVSSPQPAPAPELSVHTDPPARLASPARSLHTPNAYVPPSLGHRLASNETAQSGDVSVASPRKTEREKMEEKIRARMEEEKREAAAREERLAKKLQSLMPSKPAEKPETPQKKPPAPAVEPPPKPEPVAPERERPTAPRPAPARPTALLAAWNNFHVTAAKDEAAEERTFQREQKAAREEEARNGAGPSLRFAQTWKQVDIGDGLGHRKLVGVTQSERDHGMKDPTAVPEEKAEAEVKTETKPEAEAEETKKEEPSDTHSTPDAGLPATTPAAPAAPTDPVASAALTLPAAPIAPVASVAPVAPVASAASAAPTAPAAPMAPVAPVAPPATSAPAPTAPLPPRPSTSSTTKVSRFFPPGSNGTVSTNAAPVAPAPASLATSIPTAPIDLPPIPDAAPVAPFPPPVPQIVGCQFRAPEPAPIGTPAPAIPQEAEPVPYSPEPSLERSPSPPPPEEGDNHPAYLTDSTRPLVHFPSPKPRVRLPAHHAGSNGHVDSLVSVMPSSTGLAPPPHAGNGIQSKISPTTAYWQSKFDGLFDRKSPRMMHVAEIESPTQSSQQPAPDRNAPVAPVASYTKTPFVDDSDTQDASVFLPQTHEFSRSEPFSKNVEAEEAIFEDRVAGSLPVVRLPAVTPPAALSPAPTPTGSGRSQQRLRGLNKTNVQATSAEAFNASMLDHGELINGQGVYVVVRLPVVEKEMAKSVFLSKKHMSAALTSTLARSPSSKQRNSRKKSGSKKDKEKEEKEKAGKDSGGGGGGGENGNDDGNAENGQPQQQSQRTNSRKSHWRRRRSSVASRHSVSGGATPSSATTSHPPPPPLPNSPPPPSPSNNAQAQQTSTAGPSSRAVNDKTATQPTAAAPQAQAQAPRKPKTWADRVASGGSD